MPRLLMFAPCQKAIIDQQDQSISMISILTGIKAQPLPDDQNRATPVPPNAAAPFKWAAVSVWLRQPDDGDRTFEQRFAVHLPNGIVVEGNKDTVV